MRNFKLIACTVMVLAMGIMAQTALHVRSGFDVVKLIADTLEVSDNATFTGGLSTTGLSNTDTLDTDMHINNDGTLLQKGNAEFRGTVLFGNDETDYISYVSEILTNFIPKKDDSLSIGTAAKGWDVFASDLIVDNSATFSGVATFSDSVYFDGLYSDGFAIYDDGDTARIEADNPIKVGGDVFVGDSLFVGGVNVGGDIADLWDSLGTISPELDLYLEYSAAPDTLTASTIASGNAGSVVFLPRNKVASTAHYNVVGGTDNSSTMPWTTIGGGTGHTATAWYATIGGGYHNTASDSGATVAGGYTNTASGKQSSVGGGLGNTASAWGSTIAGGNTNTASGDGSTVSGGKGNTASGASSVVAGGTSNTASGEYSTVAGGEVNTASGYVSFAFGQYVTAADSFSAHFFTAEDSLDEAYEGELVVGGAIRVEHDTLTTAVLVDSSGLSADVDTSFAQGLEWFAANPEYFIQGVPSGSDTIRPSAYSIGDYIFIYVQTGPPMAVKDSFVIFVDLDGSDSIFAVAYDTTVTLTDTIFTAYDGVSVFRTIYTEYLTADSITAANWIAAVRVDADSMAADYFIGGISEMDYFTGDSAAVGKLKVGANGTTVVGEWKGSITWTNNTERFAISCPGMTTDGGAVWSLGGTTEADYTISLEIKADSIAFNAEPADTTAMAGKVFYYSAWDL